MFIVDSKVQKPDHALMLEHATNWAERGFKFNRTAWHELTERASEKAKLLKELGLKNPDSPKEIEWFLRSFNSLEIAAQLYNLRKARWELTVEALLELSDTFNSLPELRLLYEYKEVQATARSFSSLEKRLMDGDITHPKVRVSSTNRVMFVEPYVTGLPKVCRPFLPVGDSDAVLLSVDIMAQEATIIVNWFGSENLREIATTEKDIYTGVAKAAFTPKVVAREGQGKSVTLVETGGAWVMDKHDALVHIEDVYCTRFDMGLPSEVIGVFASGATRTFKVQWGTPAKREVVGRIVPVLEGVDFAYRLLNEERSEAKRVWSLMAYGGSKSTARTFCKHINGFVLADYIKKELKEVKFEGDGIHTYFGTQLPYKKSSNYSAVYSRASQGTGADLLALLVERFYSEPRPDGMNIYFTRYDEIVMQVTNTFISQHGEQGVVDFFTDLFECKIDDFTPLRVSVTTF